MKKFTKLMMAASAIMMGSTAFAQIRQTNLQVTLVSPAENFVAEPDAPFDITITLKNNGPDNLKVGDTLAYITPATNANSAELVVLNAAINSGQSVNLNLSRVSNNGGATADQTFDFCVRVLDPNTAGFGINGVPFRTSYSDPDTTNNDDCNKVTFKKKIVGIFEFGSAAKAPLKLYPNPATDKVAFELNLAQSENVVVSVKDITGREVIRKDFGRVQAGNNSEMSLDISRLRSGLYIVELNGEERRAVGRFTKK